MTPTPECRSPWTGLRRSGMRAQGFRASNNAARLTPPRLNWSATSFLSSPDVMH
jgi:hypothetical protein